MNITELQLYKCAFEMAVNDITAEQAQSQEMAPAQQNDLYQETLAIYLDTANQWLNAPHQQILRGKL